MGAWNKLKTAKSISISIDKAYNTATISQDNLKLNIILQKYNEFSGEGLDNLSENECIFTKKLYKNK